MRNFSKITRFCFLLVWGLILSPQLSYSQGNPENPPIPVEVEVRSANIMNFGSFLLADPDMTNNTLTLRTDNSVVNQNGNIIQLNGQPTTAALFDVYANPGTILTLQVNNPYTLTGSNGGTLSLNLDSFEINDKDIQNMLFITTQPANLYNTLSIGGTLIIGPTSANPPGAYSGNIIITLIQQ